MQVLQSKVHKLQGLPGQNTMLIDDDENGAIKKM
jgi:hypothetical protein